MVKVATTVTAAIAARREPFYVWLVPGVFFDQLHTVLPDTRFIPGVAKTTDTSGPWDVPGSHRIVHLTDGNSAREEVTAADTPDYFAYKVTGFTAPVIRRLVKEARGQWWFTEEGSGTRAKWTYTFEGKSVLAALPLLPMVKIFWKRSMKGAMKIVKERAEKEVAKAAP
jgi:hypothetical protein